MVHRVICETEIDRDDGMTDLVYAKLSLREVRHMHAQWVQSTGIERGWEAEMEHFRAHGFSAEPILGRRRDHLDGENPQEIANFPIQSGAAAHMNLATEELLQEIPFERWGPGTGLICQVHDSLVLEVPEGEAEYAAGVLERCMNRAYEALPGVRLTAKSKIGKSWKKV